MLAWVERGYTRGVSQPVPSFPHGITDADGRVGFVTLANDEIVAVDLESGSVLWRRVAAGRPLVVTEAGLVVLQRHKERLELALLDPASGDLLREIGPLPVPDWAAAEWGHPEGFVAVARGQTDQPEIAWRAQRLYRAGAAPPAAVMAPAARADAAGVLKVDPAQGRIESLPVEELEPSFESATEARFAFPVPTRTGERLYTLSATPTPVGTTRVTLEARCVDEKEPLWETVLQERATRKPPSLRW